MEKATMGPLCSLMGTFSFMAFGVIGYMNLRTPWDKTNIIFGILIGLIFGAITKKVFSVALGLLNSDIRTNHGKGVIKATVRRSTVFMFPFAALVIMAAYFMGWSNAGVFYSAAIMNTGVLASMEISKLKGKVAIKNTIATSVCASLLSYLWLFSAAYLKNVPAILKSVMSFLLPMMGVKI